MLENRSASRRIASVSIFAVIYAITRLLPIAPYVGISSTLTFGEAISPLAGMLFGPFVGASAVTLGTFLDFGLGRPVIFDGLDFLPGLASAVIAGLCFTGRKKIALAFPPVLFLVFTLDPLSAVLINAGPVVIPFLWMHILSVLAMAAVLLAASRGKLPSSGWVYVAATVFLATMTAHVMGAILYENILVRVNEVFPPSTLWVRWNLIFYSYPPERIFFTVVGTIIAVPVLRSLSRRPSG